MVERKFLTQQDDYEYVLSSGIDLLERGIVTKRSERIPVGKIVLDADIVDEAHVQDIADSMSGPRDQISPITARARLVDSKTIHYDVIDGFHRSYGFILIEKGWADAIVLYGCSDEELFDLRVLAANSVRSVQYVRVARWMQNSFAQTVWKEKGLSLSQVFGMAMNDSSGSYLGLSEEEAQEAKEWALKKSKIWNKPLSTIWQTARSIDAADPSLVYKVRLSGGKKGSGVLTPARLGAIATPLAGQYELQRRLADVVMRRNIPARDTLKISKKLAKKPNDEKFIKDVLSSPEEHLPALAKRREQHAGRVNKRGGKEIVPTIPKSSTEESTKWWRKLDSLSETEKKVLKLVIEEGQSLEELVNLDGLTPREVFQALISGLKKYGLSCEGFL